MYKILIEEELNLKAYEGIINFAVSKSDACMLVIYRYGEEEKISNPPRRNDYNNEEDYLMFLNCLERMKKERYDNLDIFKKSTEPLLEKIRPYLIKKRNFPTEWPGVKVVFYSKYTSVDICVYSICKELETYLLEAKGLFNWKYPYFPDDLCFFKNGYCWFSVVAHEEYACIYIEDAQDIEKLLKIGVKFKVTECNKDEVKLFYEDYSI
ncbi:hypothetical protein BJV85_002938 [Clostridium acetobutylicum]|uniref:Uncharacterized protein, related stage III sporulation protein AH of Bacillus sp n=1 Tax=Clostridium acetobutylicum (strain ATCC 824 / DSM 792 / JCM 1419 / IAM 19013 / LMG 5710 / NBRC 13948 / NRRL B-527 / VKM B-1787 / 2291 / W) TaxID=272562 RepID=Q97K55_CLOAB|nr:MULTISPECIES: hypothetical protein [Clostridium]AAK79040.1 Uncharacterized protein, related stage III sporulation protein AH of Bacillus sp [Clostridium acetobutylicum ATCC 824]ADZ20115.1 Conserved hypothetical protein [Clostridium acetobutylicum EA 2018]AEI31589.1 hypothetical protein SMB_G1082 [Clostridium acetobutylicum DSM 1731]AWV81705.1 hypothetical protein DK921_16735 [Clostridium acetobutylicum]MBC2395245.1 hypothetical protein [Clostridium acetobutylicum]